jgi:hypothetical protein
MRRHRNKWLCFQRDSIFCDAGELAVEMLRGEHKFGGFNSAHELYAVLQEEVDEFWQSVKEDDPDPAELLQVAAVALRGVLQLSERGRKEVRSDPTRSSLL